MAQQPPQSHTSTPEAVDVSRRDVVRDVSRSDVWRGGKSRATPSLPWADATKRFLDEARLKGRRPRTLRLHTEVLTTVRKDLDALDAPDKPGEITREHLVGMVIQMQEAGRQPRTINIRLQTLRQFFRFLVACNECPQNIAEALPKQRQPKRLPKALDDGDVARLLSALDRGTFHGLRDYTMVLVLLDTGIRLNEIIQLELGDLDLATGELKVRHRVKDHEERIVYLSAASACALRDYLRERGDLPNTRRVFVSRDEAPLSSASFQSRLQVYSREIGVTVSPHRLRHTFARGYILNGGDPFSLQAILGHSDMETVRLYVQLWGRDVQRQHEKFSPLKRFGVGS